VLRDCGDPQSIRMRGRSRRAQDRCAPEAGTPRTRWCSKPGMVRPASRLVGPSARSRAHLCGMPSRVSLNDKIKTRVESLFQTTWMGCARCRTMCPYRDMMAGHLGKPLSRVARPRSLNRGPPRSAPPRCAAARLSRSVRLRVRVLSRRTATCRRFDRHSSRC